MGKHVSTRQDRKRTKRNKKSGKGLLNKIINKLPFELHVPGYQYCGPGTKLQKRLDRGDPGINGLDRACKLHDIEYSKYQDGPERYNADKALAERAWERVVSRDASLGERATALAVTTAMKAKMKLSKIGGCMSALKKKKNSKKKKIHKKKNGKKQTGKRKTFKCLLNAAKQVIYKNPSNLLLSTKAAIKVAKQMKRKNTIVKPRIIPVPKTGGLLPLVPLFAGLSALGALTGGVSNVFKTVNELRNAKQQLEQNKNHKGMGIALGKRGKNGSNIYIKPYKQGYGLYLANQKNH